MYASLLIKEGRARRRIWDVVKAHLRAPVSAAAVSGICPSHDRSRRRRVGGSGVCCPRTVGGSVRRRAAQAAPRSAARTAHRAPPPCREVGAGRRLDRRGLGGRAPSGCRQRPSGPRLLLASQSAAPGHGAGSGAAHNGGRIRARCRGRPDRRVPVRAGGVIGRPAAGRSDGGAGRAGARGAAVDARVVAWTGAAGCRLRGIRRCRGGPPQ